MTQENVIAFSGQILLLLGGVLAAALGAGGGLRYFVEPILKRQRLRKVVASGIWLSCYELRQHMEEIRETLKKGDTLADETRDALLKIPRYDFGGRTDWLVKTGYLSMITAYKIAAFSSWIRIYQMAVLQALLTARGNELISDLYDKFDSFKISASQDTVLWYNYIDAIGERLITTSGELTSPLSFSEVCKRYHDDKEFLYFFAQLHMFIHFMGRKDEPWSTTYPKVLGDMVESLRCIETFIVKNQENLFGKYKPKERNRIVSAELSKYLRI